MQRLSKIICLAFSEGKKELEIHLEYFSKLPHLSLAERAQFLCLLQPGGKYRRLGGPINDRKSLL